MMVAADVSRQGGVLPVRLAFSVLGNPVTQGSMRAIAYKVKGRDGTEYARAALSQGGDDARREALASWRTNCATAAQRALIAATVSNTPLAGAIGLRMTFYVQRPISRPAKKFPYPERKPDVDKLERALLDAFSGVLYEDDSRVCASYKRKLYADGRPTGVDVEVWTL